MRNYELTVLIHPDLEMNIEPAIAKVKKLIEDNGGKITGEDDDGKRHTAYKVAGQDFAVYYFYQVELPTSAPAKIDKALNIMDEVIRHMIVGEDEIKMRLAAQRAAQKNDKETKEEVKEEK